MTKTNEFLRSVFKIGSCFLQDDFYHHSAVPLISSRRRENRERKRARVYKNIMIG